MKAGKKSVIMIGSIPPPFHGSSIYFQNLINSEIKSEFNVNHLDISDHRDLNNLSKLDFTNVKIALNSIFRLKKLLKKVNPDLVYIPVSSNFLPYLRDGLYIIVSSIFSEAKITVHLHEGNYFREVFYKNSVFPFKKFIEYSLAKVDAAIVYSESLKKNFDGLVKNIFSFPNGVDYTVTEQILNQKNKSTDNDVVVTYMGNFFESKGIIEVLQAAALVLKRPCNVIFKIAGEWNLNDKDLKESAFKIIEDNNIKDKIVFTGIVLDKEKQELFYETDIFIFPTWYPYEGCPLVIIEAMAYGLPVISTKDIGAINEMVDNDKTGFLTEKKNIAELSEKIIDLILNPDKRNKFGEAGRKKYENEFTFKKNLDNIINTFYKVLN